MCGIVAYVGPDQAIDFLMDGLRRLEYRGYDSAGIATLTPHGDIAVTKTVGRIDDLQAVLSESPIPGSIGIGHTRWATHGPATNENAHPHIGGKRQVAVVHNGVIENFRGLKDRLIAEGCTFQSETDTEVIAELIARAIDQIDPNQFDPDPYAPLVEAVQKVLKQLHGAYGLAVLFRDWPDVLIAAKLGSPLVVGIGNGVHYLASDGSPLVGYTDKIVYLQDHELAVMTRNNLRIIHRDQGHIAHDVKTLEAQSDEIDLGQYEHYMQKEIFEQPDVIRNAMRGRLSHDEATAKFGGLNLSANQLRAIDRFVLTACGTSWHAALVGEYMIETLARIPVEVEYASELRYRNPPLSSNTLLFAITQSGETADTLAALREMKRKGHRTLSICNVVGSSIAQAADGGIYLRAGPEIGVASTKAYTSQCVVLALLALYFGRLHHLGYEAGLRIIDDLEALPDAVEAALRTHDVVREIAAKYADCDNFLYLGRQYNFPTALEGALKLKEISYIHAEGYPAAEMKHGPIALVDHRTPSVFIVPQGAVYDKVMANLEEVKARGGPVIAIVSHGD
ncbi:MAG: glutamine--fructose-6-phosphate transaminase (isomerizing), partial [Pirellulales bacterium]|nr:glutamine--fructose-6-phosphate transaminase (isomerizing) [Pirellulales bacterium]